jgi:anti-sigma factor (TIGR02949 family)
MTDRPRAIDCAEVMERLYEYLDGELTTERAAEVKAHLQDCEACTALSSFEATFIRFLEARTRTRNAPEELKKRILKEMLLPRDDS